MASNVRIPLRPLVLLSCVALALLGGAAWLMRDRALPPPQRPTRPLPSPQPPVVAPIAETTRDESAGGFRWVNPLPRAMPTWNALALHGRGHVALAGRSGAVARIDGRGLWTWPSGLEADLRSLVWTDDDTVVVAGDGGALAKLSRSAPPERIDASGVTSTLYVVVRLDEGTLLAAGEGGVILRVAGMRSTKLPSSGDKTWVGGTVIDGQLWLAGDDGAVAHTDGRVVTQERTGAETTLRAIAGCTPDELYAAGDAGVLLRRSADGAWRPIRAASREGWTSGACAGDRVAFAGVHGHVLLVRDDQTVLLESGEDRPWLALAHDAVEGTWVAGVAGRMAAVGDDRLTMLSAGPTTSIRDLASLAGALVGVGEYGRIYREGEHGMQLAESPTKAGLAAVAALGDTELVAVGDEGAVVSITADGAHLVTAPTRVGLRDVVASGGRLLAVGGAGTVLHGTMRQLAVQELPGATDLWGIAGDPARAWLVGSGGTIVRWEGDVATPSHCPTQATLRNAVLHGTAVYAAGDHGTIVRLEGTTCSVERTGDETLAAAGLGPRGEPFVVGAHGVALARDGGGSWSHADLSPGDVDLHAIVTLDRYVYVVGSSGSVLRHVRLDGE